MLGRGSVSACLIVLGCLFSCTEFYSSTEVHLRRLFLLMLQLLGGPVGIVLPLDGWRCLVLLLELTVFKLLLRLGQSPAGQIQP